MAIGVAGSAPSASSARADASNGSRDWTSNRPSVVAAKRPRPTGATMMVIGMLTFP
jgi:hypothetical protein